jgi:hypothetical protein
MAKPKKATKARIKARKKIAENVGPERRRLSTVAPVDEERFILEEARQVREKKHARMPKERIGAIGLAKARGANVSVPTRDPHGKSKVRERSANAYRKATGPVLGRRKSTARKSGGGSGHRRDSAR